MIKIEKIFKPGTRAERQRWLKSANKLILDNENGIEITIKIGDKYINKKSEVHANGR